MCSVQLQLASHKHTSKNEVVFYSSFSRPYESKLSWLTASHIAPLHAAAVILLFKPSMRRPRLAPGFLKSLSCGFGCAFVCVSTPKTINT